MNLIGMLINPLNIAQPTSNLSTHGDLSLRRSRVQVKAIASTCAPLSHCLGSWWGQLADKVMLVVCQAA
jgi:hypothetical protein